MGDFVINWLLLCGAVLGLISVIMGALGDHAFDLLPEQVSSMDTAIRYNMLYAVLITGLAVVPTEKKFHISGVLFSLGVGLFSFSIYAALMSGISQLTYITPIGGLTIMAGWGTLIYRALRALSTP